MLKAGLVSITFRGLTPERIVELVAGAGLQGIEWGGDIHVPHGDVKRAEEVRRCTIAHGLEVAAYGSYYRLGSGMAFEPVAETAAALEAPVIRVWAGGKGSADTTADEREAIVEESRAIADVAARAGIRVAYEYHRNTLTDTSTSALSLLQAVNHPNVYTYWQPPVGISVPERLDGLNQMKPRLSHIHVFAWATKDGKVDRLPLWAGEAEWNDYLKHVKELPGERYAMLEFVKDDAEASFLADAKTLLEWIRRC